MPTTQSTPRKGNRRGGSRGGGVQSARPPQEASQSSSASPSPSPSDPPPTSSARATLSRACDLESRLSQISGSGSGGGGPSGGGAAAAADADARASRLRFELCESLSDVLLTDPYLALKKDCPGRLWRGCFYGRIGELRGRIGRERNRLKRARDRADGAAAASRHERAAEEMEKGLGTFLAEAVVLYEYLVDKYEAMLRPGQSQGQSQTQTETQSQDNVTPTSVPSGVVPTLHRLLIHLGDLRRYQLDHPAAESCYLRSSRLAPGKGNPYNQLAVVAQLRDGESPLTAASLYWYARSLMASGEAFPTSRSNLERLFAVNRQCLDKQGLGGQRVAVGGADGVARLGGKDPKARAARPRLSRMFLARFVDLHWDLFRGLSPSQPLSSGSGGLEPTIDGAVAAARALLSDLSGLLSASAFGDSLLVKLSAVCAFAVYAGGNGSAAKKAEKDNGDAQMQERRMASRALARGLILGFGARLAERAAAMLGGGKGGGGGGGGKRNVSPSLRLIAPLCVTCDFISTLYTGKLADNMSLEDAGMILDGGVSESGRDDCGFLAECEQEFWDNVADATGSIVGNFDEMQESEDDIALPSDYEGLRGFVPYEEFTGGRRPDYLTGPEASTAILGKSTGSSNGNAFDTSARIRRLGTFAHNHLLSAEERQYGAMRAPGKFLVQGADGAFSSVLSEVSAEEGGDHEFSEPPSAMDVDDAPESQAIPSTADLKSGEVNDNDSVVNDYDRGLDLEEEDDDGEDLVVYKSSGASGSGPALLVPSDILLLGARPVTSKGPKSPVIGMVAAGSPAMAVSPIGKSLLPPYRPGGGADLLSPLALAGGLQAVAIPPPRRVVTSSLVPSASTAAVPKPPPQSLPPKPMPAAAGPPSSMLPPPGFASTVSAVLTSSSKLDAMAPPPPLFEGNSGVASAQQPPPGFGALGGWATGLPGLALPGGSLGMEAGAVPPVGLPPGIMGGRGPVSLALHLPRTQNPFAAPVPFGVSLQSTMPLSDASVDKGQSRQQPPGPVGPGRPLFLGVRESGVSTDASCLGAADNLGSGGLDLGFLGIFPSNYYDSMEVPLRGIDGRGPPPTTGGEVAVVTEEQNGSGKSLLTSTAYSMNHGGDSGLFAPPGPRVQTRNPFFAI